MGLNKDGSTSYTVSGRNRGTYVIGSAEGLAFDYVAGTTPNGIHDTYDTTPLTVGNNDGDGYADYLDFDSDSDGLSDLDEGQTSAGRQALTGTDTDGDGMDDRFDVDCSPCGAITGAPFSPLDFDGDSSPDYIDKDTDADGALDWLEGFDDDGDGFANTDLITRAANYESANGNPGHYTTTDTDADGTPDFLEDDDTDNTPNFLDTDNGLYRDTDNDGLINLFDTDNNGAASIFPNSDAVNDVDFRDAGSATVLPITLVDFTAKRVDDREVMLTWSTAAEINNDYFTIERSTDGRNYEVIATISGAGTSSEFLSYENADVDAPKTAAYYRLKQTDFDGKFTYAPVRAVEGLAGNTATVGLYPNPATNQLAIEVQHMTDDNAQVVLVNTAGQTVMSTGITTSSPVVSLQVDELPRGVYFVQVHSAQQAVAVERIVLQ